MPSHLRLESETHGHWSITTGGEIGVSF
jgi:hypothetical protein